jgi:2,4-dienoyl-CoA reductase-like NADH-dependent reductase (Old Yellow Enzyme family)
MASQPNACFTPIAIGPRKAENRFVIQPMEFNDAVGADDAENRGNYTARTFDRYRNLFEGNAGMIVLEAISVGDTSMARTHQLTILPRNAKSLTKFVSDLKAVNSKPVFVAQLTHSGEISGPFSKRVSPKPMIGFDSETLTDEDADRIIDQFVEAAKIAHDVGFDGLDLKFCHGYLGAQILRPYNDRKWKYGGSKENRFRFGYEIYERIVRAVNDPTFILGSKITLYEGIPGGQGTAGPETPMMDLSEPLEFIKGIEARGASFILQSAGGPAGNTVLNEPPQRTPDEAYLHFYFSHEVKKVVKPETVVIGSAYTVFANGDNNLRYVDEEKNNLLWWSDKNIRAGVTDMVALGRQSISDPQFARKLIAGQAEEVQWCTACDGCFELLARQQKVGCVTYDREATQTLARTRREFGPLIVSRT